jgi:hypothetical protein
MVYDSSRYLAVRAQIQRGGMVGVFSNAIPHNTSTYTVTNESQTFATNLTSGTTIGLITLDGEVNIIGRTVDWTVNDRTKITSGSQVVSSGSIVGANSIDYTMDYNNGTIARIESGRFPYGATLLINYQWERPCIDVSTGSPNATCPQCSGTGYNYGSGTSVIGLPHIPKYDSPYMKLGYFQTGDLLYTVPAEYNLDIKYDGTDNLLVRDKLILDNEEWQVMSTPEKIQLGNDILAHKLHLRRRKQIL